MPWLAAREEKRSERTSRRGCLVVTRVPSVTHVLATATLVAESLGLQLPPANAQALVERYAAELGLPREVGSAAARALLLHAPKGASRGANLLFWRCCFTMPL